MTVTTAEPAPSQIATTLVDCDVHPNARSVDELRRYMPDKWRRQGLDDLLFRGSVPTTSSVYAAPNEGRRLDAFGPSGPPGSDPEFVRHQLLDEIGVDYAILIPLVERGVAHAEHEAALASACNEWLAATWLSSYDGHEHYRGSLRVGSRDPRRAVEEIERWDGYPGFVQVQVNPVVGGLLGEPQFWPIYEAASERGLPICVHLPLEHPGPYQLGPHGPVSYFWEVHGQYPLRFFAHLSSLIFGGVFERFPKLKVALVEGGFAWVLPALWRLDRQWSALGSEVPGVTRPPSEYVREHVRFTRQPVEEPRDPRHLARFMEWVDAENVLMFATDYPHWDGDYDPRQRFAGVSREARDRILATNAIELYGLPATRPA